MGTAVHPALRLSLLLGTIGHSSPPPRQGSHATAHPGSTKALAARSRPGPSLPRGKLTRPQRQRGNGGRGLHGPDSPATWQVPDSVTAAATLIASCTGVVPFTQWPYPQRTPADPALSTSHGRLPRLVVHGGPFRGTRASPTLLIRTREAGAGSVLNENDGQPLSSRPLPHTHHGRHRPDRRARHQPDIADGIPPSPGPDRTTWPRRIVTALCHSFKIRSETAGKRVRPTIMLADDPAGRSSLAGSPFVAGRTLRSLKSPITSQEHVTP